MHKSLCFTLLATNGIRTSQLGFVFGGRHFGHVRPGFVRLFLVVRREEAEARGTLVVVGANTPNHRQPVHLAVDSRTLALLHRDLHMTIILQTVTIFETLRDTDDRACLTQDDHVNFLAVASDPLDAPRSRPAAA